MIETDTKICTRCRKELPLRSALTGKLNFYAGNSKCKPCQIAHTREYRHTEKGKQSFRKSEVKQWAKGKLPKWMRDA